MYRAGVEGILGIRREGSFLVVDPCIPTAWPGFEATVKVGSTHYDIRVEAPSHCHRDASPAVLDGYRIQRTEGRVREIGRASCRERVCRYVYISVVASSFKKKN